MASPSKATPTSAAAASAEKCASAVRGTKKRPLGQTKRCYSVGCFLLDTPWKITMESTIHLFRRENDLNQTSMFRVYGLTS